MAAPQGRAGEAEFVVEGLSVVDGRPVAVHVRDGRIAAVERVESPAVGTAGRYVGPGLVDNQVNGYAGVSFTTGSGPLTTEGVLRATRALWSVGVTSYLPTLTTHSAETFCHSLAVLAEAAADPATLGSIVGFHLEGPHISPQDGFRGAHPARHVRPPSWSEMERFQAAARGGVRTVTVAPETPSCSDFIRRCTDSGVVVALGHHDADRATIDAAVLAGARTVTHLGNGCANTINRHDNPLWPQLANDALHASLICDGFHLRDDQIAVFHRVKGTERTILTADAVHLAMMPPGDYVNDEGDTIRLTPEGCIRYPAQGVLAGAALPLSRGVAKIVQVTGCPLADAIRMASANPARLYGIGDRGDLRPGMRADLIVFRAGADDLTVERTYVAGRLVHDASARPA
jgi:N-acetylglucosamine-6-phosphate deacetylase